MTLYLVYPDRSGPLTIYSTDNNFTSTEMDYHFITKQGLPGFSMGKYDFGAYAESKALDHPMQFDRGLRCPLTISFWQKNVHNTDQPLRGLSLHMT